MEVADSWEGEGTVADPWEGEATEAVATAAKARVGAEASVPPAATGVDWGARRLESAAEEDAPDLGWEEGSREGASRGVALWGSVAAAEEATGTSSGGAWAASLEAATELGSVAAFRAQGASPVEALETGLGEAVELEVELEVEKEGHSAEARAQRIRPLLAVCLPLPRPGPQRPMSYRQAPYGAESLLCRRRWCVR